MTTEAEVKAKAQKVLDEKLGKQVQQATIQTADISADKVVINPDNKEVWKYREKGKRPGWVKQLEDSGNLDANIRITRYDKPVIASPPDIGQPVIAGQTQLYEVSLEEAKKIARSLLKTLSDYYGASGGKELSEADLSLGEVSLAPLCRKYYSKNIAYKEEIIAIAFLFVIHKKHSKKAIQKVDKKEVKKVEKEINEVVKNQKNNGKKNGNKRNKRN